MIAILEYVKEHSTLILIVLGLILLAIIGYYADKTNFGQGKNTEEDNFEPKSDKSIDDFSNVKINDVIPSNNAVNSVQNQESNSVDNGVVLQGKDPQLLESVQNLASISNETIQMPEINQLEETNQTELLSNYSKKQNKNKRVETKEEESFNKFEEEFEMVLPKKNLISEDLLSDIDELELGKTQKINLSEVPDLDDIDLPKIKNLVVEEQDVWKF